MSTDQLIKKVRKHQRKSALDDNKTLMDAGLRASKQAIQAAFDAGVTITFVENGELVKLDANHKKSSVKSGKVQPKIKLRELLCQN